MERSSFLLFYVVVVAVAIFESQKTSPEQSAPACMGLTDK
jgi:hypothetical protein